MLKKLFSEKGWDIIAAHLKIVIIDNANTVDSASVEDEHIFIFSNKNVGGAGGFTRGLIECLTNPELKNTTHVLMMDDDVIIQPESIFRTYSLFCLLKPEYRDSFVGGAMLRTDKQWLQTESGGIWNKGYLVSHKQGVDLRNLDGCLFNEIEESYEFNAWWYCAMPIQIVTERNLPLPIFIRGDDVEYGLRNMKHLILLNGICVWHEPFEFKFSSSMYYYIFRNRLIDNAVRQLPYSRKEFLKDFKEQFFREVFTLRYKNARLLLDGIYDFYKGIDWLIEQDGEELNNKIIEKGYQLKYLDELSLPFQYELYEKTLQYVETKINRLKRVLTLNGLFWKAKKFAIVPVIDPHIAYFYKVGFALNYDYVSKKGFETYRSRKEFFSLCLAYVCFKRDTNRNYDRVVKEFQERAGEMTNLDFWKKYLQMSK